MRTTAIVDLGERIWRARATTGIGVVLFAAIVLRGFLVGSAERSDVEAQVRVRQHYRLDRSCELDLRGRALLWTVGSDHARTQLIGPFSVGVRAAGGGIGTLIAAIRWIDAGPGDRIVIQDEADGRTHGFDCSGAACSELSIPLAVADTTLRFEPSRASLSVVVTDLHFVAGGVAPAATREDRWDAFDEGGDGGIALGAGLWPRPFGNSRLMTSARAWLRIRPAQPGLHRLRFVLRRDEPDLPMPMVTVDGRRALDVANFTIAPCKATTTAGITTLELEVELGAAAVVGIECAAPLHSGYERGIGTERRRIAYELREIGCTPVNGR